jgi:sulfite exporter TauE/SafE
VHVIAKLFAASALGFIGSLHCAGMCGPLVIAGTMRRGRLCFRRLGAYLLGRVVSYALVGALFGQLGAEALHRLPLHWLQVGLAAAVGFFAAWTGIRLILGPRLVRTNAAGVPQDRSRSLLAVAAKWIPRRGLGLGLATGLLPCGLLIPAWLLAASTGTPTQGALVMSAFFVASSPGLLAPALALQFAKRNWLRVPVWAQGAAWLVLAAWLAVRPFVAAGHHH